MNTVPLKTLRAAWQSYADGVIPAEASGLQVQETRRAFYAGAWAVLQMTLHFIGPEETSMEQGIALLDGWHQEANAFLDRIGTPREGESAAE